MNNLADVILSKLIFYEYLDPFLNEDLNIEDLKDKLYNLWKDYKNVSDLINEGYSLDYVIENDSLLNEIIDLINEPNDKDMENIDSMLNDNLEELLENKLNGKIKL